MALSNRGDGTSTAWNVARIAPPARTQGDLIGGVDRAIGMRFSPHRSM
jgi:hypothetical protein